MIPLVLILAATAALALVIMIAARRSPTASRGWRPPSTWIYTSSDFGGYDSGADCSDASGGGDCGGGDGGGGGASSYARLRPSSYHFSRARRWRDRVCSL